MVTTPCEPASRRRLLPPTYSPDHEAAATNVCHEPPDHSCSGITSRQPLSHAYAANGEYSKTDSPSCGAACQPCTGSVCSGRGR
jgi:hypothetical protein